MSSCCWHTSPKCDKLFCSLLSLNSHSSSKFCTTCLFCHWRLGLTTANYRNWLQCHRQPRAQSLPTCGWGISRLDHSLSQAIPLPFNSSLSSAACLDSTSWSSAERTTCSAAWTSPRTCWRPGPSAGSTGWRPFWQMQSRTPARPGSRSRICRMRRSLGPTSCAVTRGGCNSTPLAWLLLRVANWCSCWSCPSSGRGRGLQLQCSVQGIWTTPLAGLQSQTFWSTSKIQWFCFKSWAVGIT